MAIEDFPEVVQSRVDFVQKLLPIPIEDFHDTVGTLFHYPGAKLDEWAFEVNFDITIPNDAQGFAWAVSSLESGEDIDLDEMCRYNGLPVDMYIQHNFDFVTLVKTGVDTVIYIDVWINKSDEDPNSFLLELKFDMFLPDFNLCRNWFLQNLYRPVSDEEFDNIFNNNVLIS